MDTANRKTTQVGRPIPPPVAHGTGPILLLSLLCGCHANYWSVQVLSTHGAVELGVTVAEDSAI